MSEQREMGINNEQRCFGFHYLQKRLPIVVTKSKSKLNVPLGMKKGKVWFKKCKCKNSNHNGIKIGKDNNNKVLKYYYNELSTNNTNESGKHNHNMMCYYYDKSNETRGSVISDLSAFGIEDCKCDEYDYECECDSMCLSDDDDDNDDICNNKLNINININIKSNNVEFNNINTKSPTDNFISFCKNIQYKLNVYE